AHAAVLQVGDVDAARTVVERGYGVPELRLVWGEPVAGAPARSGADQRADHALGVDVAHDVVAGVGDEQATVGQPAHAVRLAEARGRRGPSVARVSGLAVAHEGEHLAGVEVHPPDR